MIGKTISHYKILEKLGEGGMGVVYKAQDTKLDRIVALKFLPKHLLCDEEAKTRFAHEAKSASALNHPNITTIHEVDEVEGECFICMEYVEGKTIKELVEEKGLSIEEILRIAIQTAEGLSKAHQKGIVHRDIKSDNIMLTRDGLAKIMDFGLAKLKGATKVTKTGTTLGTLQYMSPEQAQGMEVDQRSDIFSFGVVLYEMITGQLPFKGDHEAAIIYSILNETPEPLARYKANVPERLQRIVDKALEKDRSIRYQSAAEVIADLKGLQKETTTAVVPKTKKKLLPFIIPVSIIFIIALLFLIFKPFKFEIAPEKGAIAKENSLAIMYFENLKDPEDKDKIAQMITALLITGLSESPQYMQVLSSQRLYDILKLLGKEDLKVVDKTVASEVAKKAGVRWILTGKVLQTKPNVVLVSEISETASGKIKATQKVSGATGEDVFAVVDKLSPQIVRDLSLPEQAKKELEKPIADVTTHSPEAYRYYLEGIDYDNKLYSQEAIQSFEKALEFDSTFAMAYCQLALFNKDDERKRLIAKALEYSDRASQKERYYIRGWEARLSGNDDRAIKELQEIIKHYPDEKEAFYLLGSWQYDLDRTEESVHYLTRAIEIDSLYKLAYNKLAYVYNELGDFEKSIWAINKYISLAPNEPNPYDTRGDLYAYNGKLDQAIESYKRALEMKPDFYNSLRQLGHMYLYKREYAQAESYYQKLCSNTLKTIRSEGRLYLAYMLAYQGRFDSSLKVLDDGIVVDRVDKIDGALTAYKHSLKSRIYQEKRNPDLALEEIEKGFEVWRRVYPDDKISIWDTYARLLAENKKFAEAEQAITVLKKEIGEDQTLMHSYWWAAGIIELEKGNLEGSITNLEKAAKATPFIGYRFYLGKAYVEAGRLGEAVTEFEKLLSTYDINTVFNPIWVVKAHYLLGTAYEKSGWKAKAIEQYEEFLDIWKNADPGIPEVQDAKERLKKLKGKS
jgi:serine/threonine protein kinase/predicted Zn-dependent protease